MHNVGLDDENGFPRTILTLSWNPCWHMTEEWKSWDGKVLKITKLPWGPWRRWSFLPSPPTRENWLYSLVNWKKQYFSYILNYIRICTKHGDRGRRQECFKIMCGIRINAGEKKTWYPGIKDTGKIWGRRRRPQIFSFSA